MIPPYQQARFRLAAANIDQLPEDQGFEVAIVGRSNSGKSSVINSLTAQNKLARTSKTPGRTQQIIVFDLDEERRLIDLPGYGFAKVSLKVKKEWGSLMEDYLSHRHSLKGLVVVMDIRHPLKDTDQMLLDWCHKNELPAHMLLNKSDKLGRGAAANARLKTAKSLKIPNVSSQTFSALKNDGIEELLDKLDDWFQIQRDQNEKAPV
ncbi:MAG: ribosome biogenesis GTP-binding protein YihA/YsxC [Gammaproteobacteria bacterium]|nr:ribosome biogenesis GTP-binding protein YihA/YsxC [Gammaproteobacteria bacterium]